MLPDDERLLAELKEARRVVRASLHGWSYQQLSDEVFEHLDRLSGAQGPFQRIRACLTRAVQLHVTGARLTGIKAFALDWLEAKHPDILEQAEDPTKSVRISIREIFRAALPSPLFVDDLKVGCRWRGQESPILWERVGSQLDASSWLPVLEDSGTIGAIVAELDKMRVGLEIYCESRCVAVRKPEMVAFGEGGLAFSLASALVSVKS